MIGPAPLTADHDVSGFDCGAPPLDDWLKQRALKNESRFSRTFVVCDGPLVAAYVAITAGAVRREEAPGSLRRNAPDAVPVAIIGRLAVSKPYTGRGLGADLLFDAFRRIVIAAEQLGVAAVLVQAKDDAAVRFYLAQAEFMEHPSGSRTLYLPIQTVAAAFA